jgi:hypothetical protein
MMKPHGRGIQIPEVFCIMTSGVGMGYVIVGMCTLMGSGKE